MKARRIDTSMTDADGSIVQPDDVMLVCDKWDLTGLGGGGGRGQWVRVVRGVNLERPVSAATQRMASVRCRA